VAISKPPWLTALHAFATCGTWTRGYFFTRNVNEHAMKYPVSRFRTDCNPSRPCSSRPNAVVAGKKHPTVLRSILMTYGTNAETPGCRNGNQEVPDCSAWKGWGMQAENSGPDRRLTVCECNIPLKQTAN
jgi:hypothetical protein